MTGTEQATTLGMPEDDVQSAIERLLYPDKTQQAQAEPEEEETPEPQPQSQPAPVQEADDDDAETPVTEPSAEVEGGIVETQPEPEKRVEAERVTAPEAPKTQPQADTSQDAVLAQLNQLVPQMQAAIAGEFHDIKSQADLLRLMTEDPNRYNRLVIHQQQLQYAQAEQQKLQVVAHQRWYQSEAEKLAKALPEIADPQKGVALRNELRAYALRQGYTDQQIALASSHDVVTLHKAMQFEKWQAGETAKAKAAQEAQAKAKEKAAKAPPVQKPGVAHDEKTSKAQERLQKFRQSGKTEDLAVLLQEAGIA